MSQICIVCCKALEKELMSSMESCHCTYPIIWTNPELHNTKTQYRQNLQNILNDLPTQYQTVLLINGFCGNAVQGIINTHAYLIIPRVDDCISLLFGGYQKKKPYLNSYFLTESWINGKQTIFHEYHWAVQKYGEKRADKIFSAMLCHYQQFAILDTGCYNTDNIIIRSRNFAQKFSLKQKIVPAGTQYLKDILTHPWDDSKFLIISPHQIIKNTDLIQLY